MSFAFTGPVPVPQPQSSPLHLIITGASRGIGFELVKQYATAHEQNMVFAGARNPSTATELKAFAAQHSNVHIVPLDVASEQSIRDSAKVVEQVTDHLDVLFNNAGVSGGAEARDPTTVSSAVFTSVFNTNVVGTLLVTQTYLPLLQLSTSNPKVINVGSAVGSNAVIGKIGHISAAYGVSKAALNYLTTVFRYAVPTVTFLSIHPGWVATEGGNSAGAAPTRVEDSVQAIRYYTAEKSIESSGQYLDIPTGQSIAY